MGERPISCKPTPALKSPLWFSFDSTEEDKELWLLEQELTNELERIEQKHIDTLPIGKSGNESYVDEDDEEEDEEEDDNDDEESEERDESDDEEMDEVVDLIANDS